MVYMTKPKEKEELKKGQLEVDCRLCTHYPNPNTTGKVEDLILKTNNWKHSFCGTDECDGKEYTPVNKQKDSVDKGDTDAKKQTKKDTDNIESKK